MYNESAVSDWLPCPVVFIVTGQGEKRDIMTATAMFVSESEPLVAISVSRGHMTDELIGEEGEFTLAVASEAHGELALKLGSVRGKNVDKFERFSIRTRKDTGSGREIPEGAADWMECRVVSRQELKDYDLVVARVEAHGTLNKSPLIWRKNRFFGLRDL